MRPCSIVIALLFCTSSLSAQGNIAISTGVGIPELFNLGLRVSLPQHQFAFSVGTWPVPQEESALSICGDAYFHFGGKAKLTDKRPWFLKPGFNYFRSESTFLIEKYGYFTGSVGREFNVTKRLGMQLHGGAAFEIYEHIIDKQPNGWNLDISFPVLPSIGFATFYKL